MDDRSLYARGQSYIKDHKIVGKVWFICPYAGYMTIILNDYPMAKYALLGGMLLSVLLTKEPPQ
jgi:signal peptidase